MANEYKSFYKQVGGNEGNKCNYNTRIDVYGCGCEHDCSYCYAKSLLEFRNLWNPKSPSVADIEKVKRKISKLPKDKIIRIGGMTDCFAPIEKREKLMVEVIKQLNNYDIPYLIVTKSPLVAEYNTLMRKDLAHIQITVTCFNDDLYKSLNYEKAPLPSERIKAIEKLYNDGFDISVRLSPFIPEYVDYDIINSIKCNKILVEFLRVNTWIQKWFNIDYSEYTIKQSGYWHMPLEKKMQYISNIHGKEISVCEDETEAYEYWKNHFNPNKEDCCNLRR